MIPLRLEIRNFLSYGDRPPPLDLDGVHVACLSGANGNGKSALLDAMVWALWGEPRGGSRAGDDLVRHGASEMSVALEFLMDGGRYRVTRRRTVRNRSGSTELRFEGFDGSIWRPLAEGSVGQTQDAISRLLRMTHDTFVHASFVQQGKADAFMLMTPQHRKQVLGDILNLGQYDELADAAHAAMREARASADRLSGQIRAAEAELARREEFERALADSIRAEADAQREVDELTAERTALVREVDRLVGVDRQAAEKRAAREIAGDRVHGLEKQIEELARQVAEAAATESRAGEIERDFAAFQKADEQERDMAGRFQAWCQARDELQRVESSVDRERGRIQAELTAAENRAADVERRLAGVESAQAKAEAIQADIIRYDALAREDEDARKAFDAANERLAVLRREGERLKEEPDRVRQRLELLGQNDTCPLCGQELGASGLAAAHKRLTEELREVERQLERARADYLAQLKVTKSAQERAASLREQLNGRAAIERELGDLQAQLRHAEEDRRALTEVRAVAAAYRQALESNDYALEARSRVAPLRQAMQATGYDPEAHRALRETRERLRDAPDSMRALDAARATIQTASAHRAALDAQLAAVHAEVSRLDRETDVLVQEAAALPAKRSALAAKEAELQESAAAHRAAAQRVGEAKQMVSWLNARAREVEEQKRNLTHCLEEVSAYTQLADAFGKSGIQEMIIDQALPEIEDIANELLSRLTSGRMRVRMQTQRPGRTGGTVSTLDVLVSDELGTRPYELFSGGEKFRINFAIRIALSKLLARRANAPLQMLAIDEGFGSQDREGCDRLVEAIRTVQADFERILVITHLDDLKDAFPVRIEVIKGPGGSTFAMT